MKKYILAIVRNPHRIQILIPYFCWCMIEVKSRVNEQLFYDREVSSCT